MVKGKVIRVTNHSKRSGEKTMPDGKIYKWNIITIEAETETGEKVVADSFDVLADGDPVSLEKDSEYNQWKAKKYKPDAKEDKLDEILTIVKDVQNRLPKSSSSFPKFPDNQPLTDADFSGFDE